MPAQDEIDRTQADAVWKKAFREDFKHQFGSGAFAFLFCSPLLVWLDFPLIDDVIQKWGPLGFVGVCTLGLVVIALASAWLAAQTAKKQQNS